MSMALILLVAWIAASVLAAAVWAFLCLAFHAGRTKTPAQTQHEQGEVSSDARRPARGSGQLEREARQADVAP